jgi:hypothetical protein
MSSNQIFYNSTASGFYLEVLASKLSQDTNYNTTFRGFWKVVRAMSEEYIS